MTALTQNCLSKFRPPKFRAKKSRELIGRGLKLARLTAIIYPVVPINTTYNREADLVEDNLGLCENEKVTGNGACTCLTEWVRGTWQKIKQASPKQRLFKTLQKIRDFFIKPKTSMTAAEAQWYKEEAQWYKEAPMLQCIQANRAKVGVYYHPSTSFTNRPVRRNCSKDVPQLRILENPDGSCKEMFSEEVFLHENETTGGEAPIHETTRRRWNKSRRGELQSETTQL